MLYYKWYTSPEQELIRALKNEDYNRAVSIYNGDYDGDDKTIKKALEDRIETIRQNFKMVRWSILWHLMSWEQFVR